MYLCVLAGILLATPCLADDDPLLELSVGARREMARHTELQAAFITQRERSQEKRIIIETVLTSYYILKDVAEQKDPLHLPH